MTDRDLEQAYGNVEQQLAILLRRARSWSQDVARSLHPDLTAASYALLARLLDCGPSRAVDLSAYFGIDKGAVSRQLRLLEDLGFVTREADPDDGRAQQLVLTEQGRSRLTEVRSARREKVRIELGQWQVEDVHELGTLLARLNEAQLAALGAPQTG